MSCALHDLLASLWACACGAGERREDELVFELCRRTPQAVVQYECRSEVSSVADTPLPWNNAFRGSIGP